MMCPRQEDLKVFLACGLFCRDLSMMEVGVVNSSWVETLSDLVDVATVLKDNRARSEARGNEKRCYKCKKVGHIAQECHSGENDLNVKCYNCQQLRHFSYDCSNQKQSSRKLMSRLPRMQALNSANPLSQ